MSRNIGGDGNDLSYRYKMPKLITKVEGRGNGIKTRLVNMADVAKAIHRDPAYTTKFFGCELGAQSKINEKNLEYIVNGNHDTKTFEGLLDLFIDKYVLCPNCKLPETDLSVKRQTIYSHCNACGHAAALDSAHRIAQYIIKCPPKERDQVKVKANKHAQRSKEDDEIVKKAQALKLKEDAEVKWSTDTSAEAVEQRQQEANASIIDLTQVPEEVEENNPVAQMKKIINDPSSSVDAQCKFIRSVQKRSEEKFGNVQRTYYLFEALFSENILIELASPNRLEILTTLCADPRTKKAILGGLESLLERHPALLKRLPDILTGFYEAEVLPEEFIIEFFKSPKSKFVNDEFHQKVRASAAPFIEWLENEEEDEEEEEEEEEEDKDVKVASTPGTSIKSVFAKKEEEDDDDSDLDIDDL